MIVCLRWNTNIIIWISIIAFLENIEQQQKSTKFLNLRVTKFCRFRNADTKNRNDLTQNMMKNNRYHHQIIALKKCRSCAQSTWVLIWGVRSQHNWAWNAVWYWSLRQDLQIDWIFWVKETQACSDGRLEVGWVFSNGDIQYLPRDTLLPFFHRRNVGKRGASGEIFQVDIPGQHLPSDSNGIVGFTVPDFLWDTLMMRIDHNCWKTHSTRQWL